MTEAVTWPKVLLFGDSLTQYGFSTEGCWASLLADKLQRKCDIVNRGFSGYNTRWNKKILPQVVDKEIANNIVAMTIFLGANDSTDGTINKQHVPVDEYRQNLVDMVAFLKSVGVSKDKLIFIGPPPCDPPAWQQFCKETGKPESSGKSKKTDLAALYANTCKSTAEECGVDYVDLHGEMLKSNDWQKFLIDGLHLSSKGSTVLFNLLWPLVDKRTVNLPMLFPPWDQQITMENSE